AAVGVAVLASLGPGGAIGTLNSGPFLLAVMVSALVGGTGPGLTAAGLSPAIRCCLVASVDLPLGPRAIGVWLGTSSVVELLYVHVIAARRRDEAALCRSERRFRLLAEALPHLVWATRPDGGATHLNRRWYDVFRSTRVASEPLGGGGPREGR